MTKRYQKLASTSVFSYRDPKINIPVNGYVAAYYRQSTLSQVGNVSTTIQNVDLPNYLVDQMGFDQAKVISIDTDEGMSGTKRIDERPGMLRLFRLIIGLELIDNERIGAVASVDEDRLFRDVTLIQVMVFVNACAEAGVIVITPSFIYDFAHPMMGTWHRKQFQYKCELAAEYITTVIQGKLATARRRLLLNGLWAGQPMPPGYIVDMRENMGAIDGMWYILHSLI